MGASQCWSCRPAEKLWLLSSTQNWYNLSEMSLDLLLNAFFKKKNKDLIMVYEYDVTLMGFSLYFVWETIYRNATETAEWFLTYMTSSVITEIRLYLNNVSRDQFHFTSRMVLLCSLSGLSRRFQRWDLWLRPPSSSLSVVSWRATWGRLRLRELIRCREPGSWSLNQSNARTNYSKDTTTTTKSWHMNMDVVRFPFAGPTSSVLTGVVAPLYRTRWAPLS